MTIRFADKADCAAITEIYNHAVLHTAAIWNDRTVDTDNRLAWYEARQLLGYPVLVSEENGVVTGYASFGDWRSFDGFRYTVEHSVYVHPAHQGKGLVLRGFPLSGVGHHADIILRAELTFITQSCLSLFDGFTRIVLFSARRLLRIGFPFRFGKSAGIVRLNVHTIKNQRKFTDIVKAHAQLALARFFRAPL